MLSETNEEVRFGEFALRKKTLELYRGRRRIAVQPKVLDLLIALVDNPDEVVPRRVLCDRLWPGSPASCEESLNTAVRKLRRLLRDNSQKPRFIETVPKRGYRFIAAVYNGKPPQPCAPATPTSMLQTAGTVSDDNAREAYLHGYFYWNKRSPTALQQALVCFQEADRRCPGNAAIKAAIAQAYILLASQSVLPPREAMPEARTAAIDAIRLDNQNATGFTALAWIRAVYHFDCRGAVTEFREALRLDPNNSYTHVAYSFVLTVLGRHDESISLLERAAAIDPVSLIIQALRGFARYFARQFEDAIRIGYQVVKLNPEFGIARL